MADEETGRPVPESHGVYGAHDRVKKGFWPDKFGDQEITIDLDHPDADKVKTREELEKDLDSRKQGAKETPREKSEREAREREARGRS